MEKRIGIFCAGDREIAPFLSMLNVDKTTEKIHLRFHEGTLDGVPVVMLYSGVGKVNAASAVQTLISTFGCTAVINAGTAGAMDVSLSVFDTVVGTEYAHHDVAPDILIGFHPWLESIWMKSDKVLLRAAEKAAEAFDRQIHFGRIATGEQFITDAGREEINRTLAPLSVDMESAAAAQVCYVNDVPFLSVRTITDTPGQRGIEVFEANVARASSICAEFIRKLIHNL